MKTAEVSGRKR